MPRLLLVLLLSVFCAQQSLANSLGLDREGAQIGGPFSAQRAEPETGGPPVFVGQLAPGTTTSYLDWNGSGTLASAGVLNGFITTGLNSLNGDDAHMNATGKLGTMGFSIANTNATGGPSLDLVEGEIDFFRQSDSSFISGFLWNVDFGPSGGLPAQASTRVSFADGSLESLNINLDTPDIFITTEFTNSVNTLDALDPNIGIQIRNPAGGAAAPGASSQDRLIINGAVSNSPFGGNPGGNSSYFVRLSPIPEPAMLGCISV